MNDEIRSPEMVGLLGAILAAQWFSSTADGFLEACGNAVVWPMLVCGVALALLSLPCVLGFNVWAGVEVPGIGNIQAIEDFLMSNNVLPLGALVFLLFCTTRRGWGFDAFLQEADAGAGLRFPRWARGYVRFVLPVLIVIVFVAGYVPILQVWLGLG